MSVGFKDAQSVVVEQPTVYDDFDIVYGETEPQSDGGQPYLTFGQDAVSDQQTETDMRNLEGKHQMLLQEIKEQTLGSVSLVLMCR